ncbi:irre N-terminal-like domain [Caudoviricetes sp.]|nr:irre N-terminal-like domain [Caudoviricetes sp.]UOF79664.1 irre N-terminal-like domain [Caudoviricetes sp.]UOF79861.1 irre N-terminal-like domain [Bacteriophage sp.]UOF81335.1 irre N-terminal-like domain [Caudoviricetes sp.]
MRYNIPPAIRLPFGYIIPVEQLGSKEFQKAVIATFGQRDPNCEAFMVQSEQGVVRIVVDRTLPPRVKRAAVVHELQHCMVEYLEYVKNLEYDV